MTKTILIVEDYEDTRRFMRILLESYGYEVIEATDGIEAIDKFKFSHPDLILMDISLPMVDGLTAVKAIRELSEEKQIPIIAVTAFSQDYSKNALQVECDEIINKPIDVDRLQPMLNQYLGI
jgi:CheY-like chemotaxis protein